MPALTRALEDTSPVVRSGAARALGGVGPNAKEALPELEVASKDPDATVRVCALYATWRNGRSIDGQIDALTSMLTEHVDGNPFGAAWLLGLMGGDAKPAVPALAKALGHTNALVRRNAADALGSIAASAKTEAAAAVPTLARLLGDESPEVRLSAARAWGRSVLGPGRLHRPWSLRSRTRTAPWQNALLPHSGVSGGVLGKRFRNYSRSGAEPTRDCSTMQLPPLLVWTSRLFPQSSVP